MATNNSAPTTVLHVGDGDGMIGTISATPDGLKVDGHTEQLNELIRQFRGLRLYHDLSDDDFLQEIARTLNGQLWAEVVSSGSAQTD